MDERPNENRYPLHSELREIQELIAVTWPIYRLCVPKTSSGLI
jgi:hypothetical protein